MRTNGHKLGYTEFKDDMRRFFFFFFSNTEYSVAGARTQLDCHISILGDSQNFMGQVPHLDPFFSKNLK